MRVNTFIPQGYSDQGKLISVTKPASLASVANFLSTIPMHGIPAEYTNYPSTKISGIKAGYSCMKALAKSYVGATTRREQPTNKLVQIGRVSRASIWLPHIIYELKLIILSERVVAPTY